jgi:hypothetical protein
VESNSITVSADNLNGSYAVSKRFDCGIAMLHIETAACVCKVVEKWDFLDPPMVARFIGSS